jgi:uncharacterized membrane protein YccC
MPISRHLAVLQDRLASLLPALSSAERAIDALSATGAVSAPLQARIRATVARARALSDAPDLLSEENTAPDIVASEPSDRSARETRRETLAEQAALSHLRHLGAALDDCLALARVLRDPAAPISPALRREVDAARRVPLYRDTGLALLSGGAAAAAVLVACALWIAGSWPEGAIAAQFAAIGCSFFARLDRPAPMIRSGILGILVALPFAAFYEFAIFPSIDGFPMLALVLAPVFLALSYMQSVEKLAGAALVMAVSFSGALALSETYVADFAAFVNINLAEVAGLVIAMAVILIGRTIDPGWNARRISRGAWRAIGRAAHAGARSAALRPAHLLDRVGQVSGRIEQSDATWTAALNPLQDLRVGASLATIAAAESIAAPGVAQRLRAVREIIGARYRARARGVRSEDDSALANALDAGVGELATRSRLKGMTSAVAALVSLRMDLVPEGAALA